jgi:hypothetical protein
MDVAVRISVKDFNVDELQEELASLPIHGITWAGFIGNRPAMDISRGTTKNTEEPMSRRHSFPTTLASTIALSLASGSAYATCRGLPDHGALKAALDAAVATAGSTSRCGLPSSTATGKYAPSLSPATTGARSGPAAG